MEQRSEIEIESSGNEVFKRCMRYSVTVGDMFRDEQVYKQCGIDVPLEPKVIQLYIMIVWSHGQNSRGLYGW